MSTPKIPWLVFYTKSRHEKKVRDVLVRRGFDVFLPMQKVFRQWSDRKKKVEVPLFNSYIFVKIPYHRAEEVLQVPGVAWAIRYNDKPAELQPKEYETIVRFIETGLLIEDLPADSIEVGEQVEVMDGPLKGLIGQVEGKGSGKFIVVLQALGRAMRVEVKPLVVRKV
ncbi:MAG: UpxY family transcription antiterminator [Cyclobacteriaceae bacterium]|nr:UpxY family transcription antiterminator [Cyclobacteriaceae bacterium]